MKGRIVATQTTTIESDVTEVIYDIVTTALYVVLIAAQVTIILDEVSDGAFTRQMQAHWLTVKQQWQRRQRINFAMKKGTPVVLFEATQIVGES